MPCWATSSAPPPGATAMPFGPGSYWSGLHGVDAHSFDAATFSFLQPPAFNASCFALPSAGLYFQSSAVTVSVK